MLFRGLSCFCLSVASKQMFDVSTWKKMFSFCEYVMWVCYVSINILINKLSSVVLKKKMQYIWVFCLHVINWLRVVKNNTLYYIGTCWRQKRKKKINNKNNLPIKKRSIAWELLCEEWVPVENKCIPWEE